MTTTAPADGAQPPVDETIPVQTNTPAPIKVATETPPAADPEPQAASEPATEDNSGADTPQAAGKVPKLPDWAQKKIADTAFSEREAKRQLKEAQEELARLRGAAPAPQTQAPPTQANIAAAEAAAPPGGYRSQEEFQAAVRAETERMRTEELQRQALHDFNTRSNAAYTAGTQTYGQDFDAAVQNLQQIGVMNEANVALILETDDPARVFFELGSDPDRAAAIAALPPIKRAVEIAKLGVTPAAAPKPPPLSRAPRPVEPVTGSARVSEEPSDTDSEAEWFAKRNAQIAKRYAR